MPGVPPDAVDTVKRLLKGMFKRSKNKKQDNPTDPTVSARPHSAPPSRHGQQQATAQDNQHSRVRPVTGVQDVHNPPDSPVVSPISTAGTPASMVEKDATTIIPKAKNIAEKDVSLVISKSNAAGALPATTTAVNRETVPSTAAESTTAESNRVATSVKQSDHPGTNVTATSETNTATKSTLEPAGKTETTSVPAAAVGTTPTTSVPAAATQTTSVPAAESQTISVPTAASQTTSLPAVATTTSTPATTMATDEQHVPSEETNAALAPGMSATSGPLEDFPDGSRSQD